MGTCSNPSNRVPVFRVFNNVQIRFNFKMGFNEWVVNAALSARSAFVEVDASARVRRALLKKITMKTEVYNQGDKVFFRRGNDRKWHGPGTVIGVDGKVIFV